MPIFTTLLFFFIALALWPLARRKSGQRELRKQYARALDRVETSAKICVAAAKDAFGISLDNSLTSIAVLDAMISNGWTAPITDSLEQPTNNPSNATFILGAYLGDVFVNQHLAEWHWEQNEPLLYFPSSEKTVSPFELIERKMKHSDRINLSEEITEWQQPDLPAPDHALAGE